MTHPDLSNIPASLTAKSYIGDICVAYGFCTRENVDAALEIQKKENAAITEAERAAGKKSRLTGVILVAERFCTQEQIDFGMQVQDHLRKTAS